MAMRLKGLNVLSARIKSARIVRKLTQAQCAEFVGVHPSNWVAWERGETRPSKDLQGAVAECLGVGLMWLLAPKDEDVMLLNSLTPAKAPGVFLTQEEAAEIARAHQREVTAKGDEHKRVLRENHAALIAAQKQKLEERARAEAERREAIIARRRSERTEWEYPCRLCGTVSRLWRGNCENCRPLDRELDGDTDAE